MRRMAVAVALAISLVGAGAALPAYADIPTCNGLPVTMDITDSSGVIVGTDGDDVILVDPVTTAQGITVYSQGGNDTACLDQPADVYGGPGDDTIIDSQTNKDYGAVLDGGPGDDVLQGGPAGDTLYGDSGNDHLSGGKGDDTLAEGTGTPGDDVVDGGPGVDEDDFGDLTSPVTIDLATGTFSGFGDDTITSIEDWRGSSASDTLVGGDGNDILEGGPGGNDTIVGGGGDDLLFGPHLGAWNDSSGTADPATITGGPGNDQVYAYAGTVDTDTGNDDVSVRGPVDTHLGSGADHVFVGSENAARVRVHMGPGNDDASLVVLDTHGLRTTEIWGDDGRDTFRGGPERDLFRGGPGNDVLRGDRGADTLLGNAGHDTAYGGAGPDRCVTEIRHGC